MILAGGRGTRMGGVEKGLLDWQGRPLMARLIEDLAPQVDRLLINANRAHERYAAFGLPLIADDPRHAGLGPLAGVHAALTAVKVVRRLRVWAGMRRGRRGAWCACHATCPDFRRISSAAWWRHPRGRGPPWSWPRRGHSFTPPSVSSTHPSAAPCRTACSGASTPPGDGSRPIVCGSWISGNPARWPATSIRRGILPPWECRQGGQGQADPGP